MALFICLEVRARGAAVPCDATITGYMNSALLGGHVTASAVRARY
jgi:hypothetical protein